MTEWIATLQQNAFTVAGASISWSELLGDISGAVCVWLVARQDIRNWPIGILNNVFFLTLFIHARLYADAALQIVFAILGAYGWWTWLHGRTGDSSVQIRRTTLTEWSWLAGLTLLATFGVSTALARWTDSPVPVADATVFVLSLVATYGQAKKLIESWWIWIAVDVISVPLYMSRGLYPTAVLYAVFGLLCVGGLRSWRSALSQRDAVTEAFP